MKYLLSYDLGTGGTKASLYDETGALKASTFVSCTTYYPQPEFREQRPEEWWQTVVISTGRLLKKHSVPVENIAAMAVSGHSLGVVPVGESGLLLPQTPIWNDTRAIKEAADFFKSVDETSWYLTTGNGFPPPLYSVFKIMWYRNNMPEIYHKTRKFIGTKDYINYKLTGILCTDHSYASGSGVYGLKEHRYIDAYITAAGISKEKLPDIYSSTHIVGQLLPEAAAQLGLHTDTLVICGGVDNACMALGAACITEGDAYTNLGTSSWIAVASKDPVLNINTRPYVFAHCIPEQYVSATCIFSAGNSFRWVRDTLCKDLLAAENAGGMDAYQAMDAEAALSPMGAHRLLFNPSLAGGSGLDKSPHIRGAYLGLDLMHTRGDILRATLEGICLNLRIALNVMEQYVSLSDTMLLVGGGSKSAFWRQLFANIYNKSILKTTVGEDAGSLGAATLAAMGCGLWQDVRKVKEVHTLLSIDKPQEDAARFYEALLPIFQLASDMQSDLGNLLHTLNG